jgi:hypothetical protein
LEIKKRRIEYTMSSCKKNYVKIGSDELLRKNEQVFDTVRKAWKLTTPEAYYREPRWLRAAAYAAGKAGRLPALRRWDLVTNQLHGAGYQAALDHIGIVCEKGERHVILEPYESRCSIDTARRMASELASKLQCRAWVSLRSWHVPGATIRITLAPSPTFASVATVPPNSSGMPSHQEDATQGQCGPRGASAKVALNRKLRRN